MAARRSHPFQVAKKLADGDPFQRFFGKGYDYAYVLPRNHWHRAKFTPRVNRHIRTRQLSKLTSFYRNRFYEVDSWYKARIPEPILVPKAYLIDPDRIQKTLAERLNELQIEDDPLREKVDIGLPVKDCAPSDSEKHRILQSRDKMELERKARRNEIVIDTFKIESSNHAPLVVRSQAQHCNIFADLFHADAFFHPVVPLHVVYTQGDTGRPVYYGNTLSAVDSVAQPEVGIGTSVPDSLWTLILVNPDGNIYHESGKEVLHWMVTNIKGSDISSGSVVCPYLQPLPLRGTGWHRSVFVLFRQAKEIDTATYQCATLHDRSSFSTAKFYRSLEDDITPAGLAWSQVTWDDSCTQCFHRQLDMAEPVYEFEWPEDRHEEMELFKKHTFGKRYGFDEYLDKFRDESDLEKEVLEKRLKRVSPFEGDQPRERFPNWDRHRDFGTHPTWLLDRLERERFGLGRYKHIYENRLK